LLARIPGVISRKEIEAQLDVFSPIAVPFRGASIYFSINDNIILMQFIDTSTPENLPA
jgi:hypothetical protein